MKVVISNKSKLGNPSKVVISNKNNVGRVIFGKITKIDPNSPIRLEWLDNVDVSGQKDGDVLVYDASSSMYKIETLPRLDGGFF